MAQTVQRLRGQGRELTLEQVAAEQVRARLAAAIWGTGGHTAVWTPEETAALRAQLAGEEVTA